MDMNLKDKVFVVTGAGLGIGRSSALALGRAGATIIATDLNEDLAKETSTLIKVTNNKSLYFKLDVRDSDRCNQVANQVFNEFGRIDGWLNNAGVSSMNRLVDLTEEDWDFNMDINAKGVFFGTQAAARIMLKQSPDAKSGLRGKIINIASMAAKRGNAPYLAHYVASKFAVLGFTQAVAGELAEFGITANSICPGYVATSMQERELAWEANLRGVTVEDVKNLYISDTPLERLQTAEDVAAVVLFLASSLSDFLTGEAINVNGGAFMD
jgi:meso-butanediol dehydrogenase/(S,S)-butanediol dehydrogenase/diacetyl reductase